MSEKRTLIHGAERKEVFCEQRIIRERLDRGPFVDSMAKTLPNMNLPGRDEENELPTFQEALRATYELRNLLQVVLDQQTEAASNEADNLNVRMQTGSYRHIIESLRNREGVEPRDLETITAISQNLQKALELDEPKVYQWIQTSLDLAIELLEKKLDAVEVATIRAEFGLNGGRGEGTQALERPPLGVLDDVSRGTKFETATNLGVVCSGDTVLYKGNPHIITGRAHDGGLQLRRVGEGGSRPLFAITVAATNEHVERMEVERDGADEVTQVLAYPSLKGEETIVTAPTEKPPQATTDVGKQPETAQDVTELEELQAIMAIMPAIWKAGTGTLSLEKAKRVLAIGRTTARMSAEAEAKIQAEGLRGTKAEKVRAAARARQEKRWLTLRRELECASITEEVEAKIETEGLQGSKAEKARETATEKKRAIMSGKMLVNSEDIANFVQRYRAGDSEGTLAKDMSSLWGIESEELEKRGFQVLAVHRNMSGLEANEKWEASLEHMKKAETVEEFMLRRQSVESMKRRENETEEKFQLRKAEILSRTKRRERDETPEEFAARRERAERREEGRGRFEFPVLVQVSESLGSGFQAKRVLAAIAPSGEQYAVRVLNIGQGFSPSERKTWAQRLTERTSAAREYETNIAAGLSSHPNIVQVYGFAEMILPDEEEIERPELVDVVELVRGEDLSEKIYRSARFSTAESLELLTGIVEGIKHCHDLGFILRDLKPQNILVSQDGIAKLSDLQLATKFENYFKNLRADIVTGTPMYLPPEVLRGEMPRTGEEVEQMAIAADMYALGITVFNMTTEGKIPLSFVPNGKVTLQVLLHAKLKPLHFGFEKLIPPIPYPLQYLIEWLSADDWRKRPRNMEVVHDFLRAYQMGSPELPFPGGPAVGEEAQKRAESNELNFVPTAEVETHSAEMSDMDISSLTQTMPLPGRRKSLGTRLRGWKDLLLGRKPQRSHRRDRGPDEARKRA